MGLADHLDEPTHERFNKCRIAILRTRLDKKNRDALDTFLADPVRWGHRTVGKWLVQDHPEMFTSAGGAADTVGRHRKGDCGCDKSQ